MLEYLKKKSIGSFICVGAAVFALAMTIAYGALTGSYGFVNAWAIVCLVLVIALNGVLFALETKVDEYFKVVATVLTAVALGLFLYDAAGDLADNFNGIELFGHGAPVGSIYGIAVCLVILMIVQIVTCFFGKKVNK